jgi:hypothetical protein
MEGLEAEKLAGLAGRFRAHLESICRQGMRAALKQFLV